MLTSNKRLACITGFAGFLLLVPLVAMQFTNEVNWSPFDFIIAGILLFGTGFTCELVLRFVKKTSHRIALLAAVLFCLLLIWAELAVGIFNTPLAGN